MMIGGFELLIVMGFGALIAVMLLGGLGKNRPGMAIVFGGLAFLGLLLGAGLLFALLSYRAVGRVAATPLVEVGPGTMVPSEVTNHNIHTTWDFSLGGVFLAAVIIAVIVLSAGRRAAMAHAVAGHRRLLPFLLIPLAALFFLGQVRWQVSRDTTPRIRTESFSSDDMGRQHAGLVSHAEKVNRDLQRQQKAMAEKVVSMNKNVQNRIAKMDIHELMDKVDEPRIALQSDAEKDPKAPEAPQAPSAPAAADPSDVSTTSNAASEEPPAEIKVEKGNKSKSEASDETSEKRADKPDAKNDTKEDGVAKESQDTKSNEEEAKETKQVAAEAELPTTKEITAELAAKVLVTRPDWVDSPPTRTGDVSREVIATDAYATPNECYRAADVLLMYKTYERLQELNGSPSSEATMPSISFQNNEILADGTVIYIGVPNGRSWQDYRLFLLNKIGIGPEFVRRVVVATDPKTKQSREFLEQTEHSVGTMNKLYLQTEFSPVVDRLLRERWEANARQERFAMVGVGATSILGLLGCVFGLLKIDTWTKGYYTKRLFIGLPAAIIGGGLLFAILGKLIARTIS